MEPIYAATNGMHEAIRLQAEREGLTLAYEYDHVVWFSFAYAYSEDEDKTTTVDVTRDGKIKYDGNAVLLSSDMKNMLKAFALLMPQFWAAYYAGK